MQLHKVTKDSHPAVIARANIIHIDDEPVLSAITAEAKVPLEALVLDGRPRAAVTFAVRPPPHLGNWTHTGGREDTGDERLWQSGSGARPKGQTHDDI